MSKKVNPGALAGATGAGNAFQAAAGGTEILARKAVKGTAYRVMLADGETFAIIVSGRTRWALDRLRAAGNRGITSLSHPAARLSAYVHTLRELGLEIETLREPHEGDFPGWHGRYVLQCRVEHDRNGGAA